jgi:hypothetical protein
LLIASDLSSTRNGRHSVKSHFVVKNHQITYFLSSHESFEDQRLAFEANDWRLNAVVDLRRLLMRMIFDFFDEKMLRRYLAFG